MRLTKKSALSAITLLAASALAIIFFLRLNNSREEIKLENGANEFLIVSELTAESISFGYFQWDDMYYAISENDEAATQNYFDEIYELSPFIKNIEIIRKPADYPEEFYSFSGTAEGFYCDFKIFDGSSSILIEGLYARAEFDIESISGRIWPKKELSIGLGENGYDIGYGLKLRTSNPPIYFFQIISALVIGLFAMVILNRIRSRTRHFFYETRGLEKVIFLFERTEKYSADHSRRVATITRTLGKKLKLSKRRLKDLNVASLLHDIGKISVPVEVLNKSEGLSRDEYNTIKEHVIYSAQIIENFEELTHLQKIILCHHEKMDGSGYPHGLKGNEIPFASRIIAVADIFEALIGKRPYRAPIEPHEAVQKMRQMSLDNKILNILEENLSEIMTRLESLK